MAAGTALNVSPFPAWSDKRGNVAELLAKVHKIYETQ